jgi:hypothetical protein
MSATLHFGSSSRTLDFMTGCRISDLRIICITLGLFVLPAFVGAARCAAVEPTAAAVAGFTSYIDEIETRLTQQHRSQDGFIAPLTSIAGGDLRLRRGELIVERLTPSGGEFPGAMLHHWRGTAFVPGARAADFERLMRDFNSYPQHFSPQVLRARVMTQQGDPLQVEMRVKQRHVITVVMDTAYDINFGRLDAQHGYSIARSTRISEVDAAGTNAERTLDPRQEHGFLWRLNTYWSYEERDGGLSMQIESVSLTRSIPTGLGWVVGPFVESIPRESLEFTLRSVYSALRK